MMRTVQRLEKMLVLLRVLQSELQLGLPTDLPLAPTMAQQLGSSLVQQ